MTVFFNGWNEFQEKVAKKLVDYQGITHFFSTALDRIGLTNHYDYPEKICINEQFYSWYFFDCITKVCTAIKNDI